MQLAPTPMSIAVTFNYKVSKFRQRNGCNRPFREWAGRETGREYPKQCRKTI